MKRSQLPTGIVIYEGPSQVDRQPIVAILASVKHDSRNPKTGPMYQLFILRSDLHPMDALREQKDFSICGNCPHRPVDGDTKQRSCYVKMHNVGNVYNAYKKGVHIPLDWDIVTYIGINSKKGVRLGAYGDPAAVPFDVMIELVNRLPFHTGYTHFMFEGWFDARYKDILMASVDEENSRQVCEKAGIRYFRVTKYENDILPSEVLCLNTADKIAHPDKLEPVTCSTCKLCDGSADMRKPNVVNYAHGHGAKYIPEYV